MMIQEDMLIAGWFGKIPSRGDFISRRLPGSFIELWDTWLQRAMTVSRTHLGERWLDLYLTSPIWRFILMPGICGDNLWTGVFMPSIDKVGRHFPLTIAIQVKSCPKMLFAAFSAQTWYGYLEQLALASLNVNQSPDDLDRNLVIYPFPASCSSDTSIPSQELANWWRTNPHPGFVEQKSLILPTVSILAELFETAGKNLFMSTGKGKSIWWNDSLDMGASQLLCFTGLPSENSFAALLGETITR